MGCSPIIYCSKLDINKQKHSLNGKIGNLAMFLSALEWEKRNANINKSLIFMCKYKLLLITSESASNSDFPPSSGSAQNKQ